MTEEQETAAGEEIAEMLNLKEAKHGTHPRNLKSYNPRRWHTQWGTKSALGLVRSIETVLARHRSAHKP